jgi:hypothetical protein
LQGSYSVGRKGTYLQSSGMLQSQRNAFISIVGGHRSRILALPTAGLWMLNRLRPPVKSYRQLLQHTQPLLLVKRRLLCSPSSMIQHRASLRCASNQHHGMQCTPAGHRHGCAATLQLIRKTYVKICIFDALGRDVVNRHEKPRSFQRRQPELLLRACYHTLDQRALLLTLQ